jgi:polysaccharide deacetylase family protein (PEP-CTERM system associated)
VREEQVHSKTEPPPAVVLSFDVEEHYRIEAAAHLQVEEAYKHHCRQRVDYATNWLLDELGQRGILATFFVVGQIARDNPRLVQAIAQAGHEVASHSWDHQRIHRFNPQTFRADLRQGKDSLEQVTGQPVLGFRAPTFSIVPQTAWALDILTEEGMLYDSSIYPVRHDRYGIPTAPRSPFMACGQTREILELPPATLRLLGMNLPMGGGGYFRLFPLMFTRWAIRQMHRQTCPAVATLYFHPWEFDPEQERLALGRLSRLRTYVGIRRSQSRLGRLLQEHTFTRAIDAARALASDRPSLPRFAIPGKPRLSGLRAGGVSVNHG